MVAPLAETPDEFKNLVNITDDNINTYDNHSYLGQYSLMTELFNG